MSKAKAAIADVLFVGGLAVAVYGLWQIHPSYAWTVAGASLAAVGVLIMTRK